MAETLKISKTAPSQKSQNYKLLREEGIKYIQEMAGKIWTDYNIHDPGITILEELCYAITDLGYRVSYPMNDILAPNQNSSEKYDIKNFYTARQILPNAPLTRNDYRKLLIDTDIKITIPETGSTELVGIKNAWIDKSESAEVPFFVDVNQSTLSYTKDSTKPDLEEIQVGVLYNILLEFNRSKHYGDLNENSIEGELSIDNNPDNPALNNLVIDIKFECPRWDENIDWNDLEAIINSISKEKIRFTINNLPNNYSYLSYSILGNKKLEITIIEKTTDLVVDGLDYVNNQINKFIFDSDDGLIKKYQEKIKVIQQIIDKVKAKLHNNRNLCEDFYKINALKVEEIAVCADIELELNTNIEQVQAKIYHSIEKFLSPVVNFYTIQEMLESCKTTHYYSIRSIDKINKIFTIDHDVTEKLSKDDIIEVINSLSNDGEYTVVSVSDNYVNSSYSDIKVNEDIPSDILTDGGLVCITKSNDNECYRIDTIFEGPPLEHGFIDNTELANANRQSVIHVSDLIKVIMDIQGVVAVKEVQIANVPQDNENNQIPSKNVKWCLNLAFGQNYVPRLGIDLCKFRFFKENIPFRADREAVEDILVQLQSKERVQKLENPKLDIDIPMGKYRDIEDYTSIQMDFPLNYGIGFEGIPNLSKLSKESKTKRIAQANQLKGYLMFFDQLLANYLSQLEHIKDLFSMNAERDEKGNFIIGRTYYTQPLFDVVPNSDTLYINKDGHLSELSTIAENETLFALRRNKFLDHLLARFSEQFSDYALLLYQFSSAKASTDLIEDKLVFLNSYPDISSNRGKGFNHKHPDKIWHINNMSGLEKRASVLMGIPPKNLESLCFSENFTITESSDEFLFTIASESNILLKCVQKYKSIAEVKEILELIVINGIYNEKFVIKSTNETQYYFDLVCNNIIIGTSYRNDYSSKHDAEEDISALITVLENEFYDNSESNRNNISCPFYNYFSLSEPSDNSDGSKILTFKLYSKAFEFLPENCILTGEFTTTASSEDAEKEEIQKKLWEVITSGIISDQYIFSNEEGYVFNIGNRAGKIIATSIEKDFNQNFANRLKEYTHLVAYIANSVSNDGSYPISNVTAIGSSIILKCDEKSIPSANKNGNLILIESFIYDTDVENNKIIIGEDITHIVEEDYIIVLFNLDNKNTNYYIVDSYKIVGTNTEIVLNKKIDYIESNTRIGVAKTYPYALDALSKTFYLDFDPTIEINDGDIITMWDSNNRIADYTVKSFQVDGSKLKVRVYEEISNDIRGKITLTKVYSIVSVKNEHPSSPSELEPSFTINGGEDVKAVKQMTEFLKSTFINREGFHVIEHPLLRPKIKGLQTELNSFGDLFFLVSLPVFEATATEKKIIVKGDYTSDFKSGSKIKIPTINFSTEQETVKLYIDSIINRKSKDSTEFKVIDDFTTNISNADVDGTLSYQVKITIKKIDNEGRIVLVSNEDTILPQESDQIEIKGSSGGINDGYYYVKQVDGNLITVISDKLMPVILDKKCTNQIKDPYTSIASVVLPYWPERFNNSDFRKFFEKTLRMEAPAHVFLRICWVNTHHMHNLEKKYKRWIVENSRVYPDQIQISMALSELIDALYQLRNVYPVGTLYDPEEHETLQNAIVLNNTMIGNA